MTITLTEEQEAFVTKRMEQDGYASPQEMINVAFQLLQEQDFIPAMSPSRERELVREGVEALKGGRYKTFNSADDIAEHVITAAQRRAGLA